MQNISQNKNSTQRCTHILLLPQVGKGRHVLKLKIDCRNCILLQPDTSPQSNFENAGFLKTFGPLQECFKIFIKFWGKIICKEGGVYLSVWQLHLRIKLSFIDSS